MKTLFVSMLLVAAACVNAEELVEGVGEAGRAPLRRLRAVVDVAAVAQHALAVEDVDVRRHARAVRAGDAAVAIL